MKAQHLHAMYARRRELEHQRIERTEAVNRYYDHWDRVTSRYNNWTTPEYYKQAEDKLQQCKDKKEKAKQLVVRQEKLAEILKAENSLYEEEMLLKSRPNIRKYSNKTLEKVDENLKKQDNIRRKIELEGKLYGRWRHGVDDDNLLFQSKSDHEVLAKLNWLDKQVENQMQREKEEAEAQERNLRLQEELNKAEQLHKERQQIREQEIREIRTIQENYMEQLKEKQEETEMLKKVEDKLRENLEELNKEQELLEQSIFLTQSSSGDLAQAFNLKKIKVTIRKRLEAFREQINLHITMLERIKNFASKKAIVEDLLQKYKEKYEAEAFTLSQIEAMYESEAKYSLIKYEESWNMQSRERNREMKELLNAEKQTFKTQLNECLRRQEELLEIRSTCLSAIEVASEKLKQLIKEEEESPRNQVPKESIESNLDAASKKVTSLNTLENKASDALENKTLSVLENKASGRNLPNVTNSFTNLNLDVLREVPTINRAVSASGSTRSLQVVTPETVERPKFGRKRIAWT